MDTAIRKATPADIEKLYEISVRTYMETFDSVNTEKNMREYLGRAFEKKKLLGELSNPHSEFYFAYCDGTLAGYLKLNEAPSQTDVQDEASLEVERLYVARDFQGAGIGRSFMELAVRLAKERKKRYVWLGVWEHNEKAKRFYAKYGFYKIGEHPFVMGDDAQTDYVMRKDLE